MLVEDAQCFTTTPSLTAPLPGGCLTPSPTLSLGGGGEGGGYYTMFLFH